MSMCAGLSAPRSIASPADLCQLTERIDGHLIDLDGVQLLRIHERDVDEIRRRETSRPRTSIYRLNVSEGDSTRRFMDEPLPCALWAESARAPRRRAP